MTTRKALQTIVDNANLKSLNYAVNYAVVGLSMDESDPGYKTQLLYVLSNMTHWRGPLAKQVRQALKGATS
jgi:hypothetical protein